MRIVTSCIDPTQEIEDDVLLVPPVGVPFAEREQGYSFGGAFSAELQQSIEEFNPNVVHFTVPDPVALKIMNWARIRVSRAANCSSCHAFPSPSSSPPAHIFAL